MHVLCYLGLHRWETKTKVGFGFIRDYYRCKRPGCRRFPEWRVANEEETPRYLRDQMASRN